MVSLMVWLPLCALLQLSWISKVGFLVPRLIVGIHPGIPYVPWQPTTIGMVNNNHLQLVKIINPMWDAGMGH